MHKLGVYTSGSSNGGGVFGNGADGSVTLTTPTYLTKDMYYQNLTISSTTLFPQNYRIFVNGTLTMTSGSTLSFVGVQGNSAGYFDSLPSIGTLGGPTQGGAGAFFDGATPVDGDPGVDALYPLGGAGGSGGDGVFTVGGLGGYAVLPVIFGSPVYGGSYANVVRGTILTQNFRLEGGTGGGGGGGKVTPDMGGSGGSGGGLIQVFARYIDAQPGSAIDVSGGKGGEGVGDGCAGGGGGGGGAFVCFTDSPSANLQWGINLDGGSGGAGFNSGSDGAVGYSFIITGDV